MKIHDGGDFTPFTAIEIPYYMYFAKNSTDEDYEKQIREEIRLQSGTLFQLANFLSMKIREDGDERNLISEFITLVSLLGEGFQNSIEDIDLYFKDRKKELASKVSKETPNVLDLSSHPTAEDKCIDLAEHISAVLSDPNTPRDLEEVIYNSLMETGRSESFEKFIISPKVIAERLCSKEVK